MTKAVTLSDIARESKVSLSTVSLVLREKPGIPPETRQRVLDAARALGYRSRNTSLPDPGQHGIGKLHTVGLIIKSAAGQIPYSNPFYSYVLAGIEDACRRSRINLLFATILLDERNHIVETPRLLRDDSADGLLLVGALIEAPLTSLLNQTTQPVVLVDAYASRDQYDAVLSDNVRGAYQAVQHLIDHGHRHIGMIGAGQDSYPSLRERQDGYLQALRANGITAEYSADCFPRAADAGAATAALLQEHPQITALFGANDEVAIAAMRAVQATGRRVPETFSVIGFDDIDLARLVMPGLTTMHVDKVGMGRQAVQLLSSRVEFPDAERVTAVISPRLVARDSVAAASGEICQPPAGASAKIEQRVSAALAPAGTR